LNRDPSPFDRKGERELGAGGAAESASLGTFLGAPRKVQTAGQADDVIHLEDDSGQD